MSREREIKLLFNRSLNVKKIKKVKNLSLADFCQIMGNIVIRILNEKNVFLVCTHHFSCVASCSSASGVPMRRPASASRPAEPPVTALSIKDCS